MSRTWVHARIVCELALAISLATRPAWAGEDGGHGRASADASATTSHAGPTGPPSPETSTSVGEPFQVLKSGPGTGNKRVIYRAKVLPVTDLEITLRQLFVMEGNLQSTANADAKAGPSPRVAIAVSVVNNSLIISRPTAAVEEVMSLLHELDQSGGQIVLDVEIGEADIDEEENDNASQSADAQTGEASVNQWRWAERPAKMKTIGRVRLTALDNQAAFAQMGARVPMVESVSRTADRELPTTSLMNVGLLVGVTPRVNTDGSIVMEIDAEQSELGSEAEGIPISIAGGQVVRTPRIDNTTIQTTLTVADGQTVVLGAVARSDQTNKALVIVITPHIIRPNKPETSPNLSQPSDPSETP